MELETIRSMIYEVRGVRVMLDFDLARLYQVENRTLCAECVSCWISTWQGFIKWRTGL